MLERETREMTLERRDDEIQEMLLLAARLKEAHGGDLDDAAIVAVSEATGAPVDYVRLALRSVEVKRKASFLQRIRGTFLALDPDVRRYVASGWLACGGGFFWAAGLALGDRTSLFGIGMLVATLAALWNCSVAKDRKTAAIAGAIFGGLLFVMGSVFTTLFSVITAPAGFLSAGFLIAFLAGGAILGGSAKRIVSKNLTTVGIQDKNVERQELLRQLVELQDKLRSGEQSLAFLSIDVVGSTRMKELADALAVEFTFNEYHQYVENVVRRNGGQVHSTAGDGITAAFERPDQAFRAARALQSGLIELNTHRNKIGTPIKLRIGLHHGTVVAPTGDVQSVNFAHVIDIAAHLQKVCPEGGVALSDAALGMIPNGTALVGNDRIQVQNVRGTVWLPRSMVKPEEPAAPPPVPPRI